MVGFVDTAVGAIATGGNVKTRWMAKYKFMPTHIAQIQTMWCKRPLTRPVKNIQVHIAQP
jgi:hypothetical protein